MVALVATGCFEDDLESYNPDQSEVVDYEDYREPADLTVVVDLEQLMADFDQNGPITRVDPTYLNWTSETTLATTKPSHREVAAYGSASPEDKTKFWDDGKDATTKLEKQRYRLSEGRKNFDNDEISSLAFFLVDMQMNSDGSRPRRYGRIVAYRLFAGFSDGMNYYLPERDDNTGELKDIVENTILTEDEKHDRKYFYYDLDNIAGHSISADPHMNKIPMHGRTYTDNSGQPQTYDYHDDFVDNAVAAHIYPTTEENYEAKRAEFLKCGFNGYALMDDNGELLPDDAANDKGWGNGFYAPDRKGEMEASKAVILSFVYEHPLHPTANDIEKLRRGDVWVMAVANFHLLPTLYKGHPFGYWVKEVVDYWQRHKDDDDFYGIPANPVDDKNHVYHYLPFGKSMNGDAADNYGYIEVTGKFCGYLEMADAAVRQNDSRVTDPAAAAAAAVQDVTLEGDTQLRHYKPLILSSNAYSSTLLPGENIFRRRLTRLPSRVTFTIANHSSESLTVEDFALSSNFAQTAAWIFQHDNQSYNNAMLGNYFKGWRGGVVDVWSNKALVPFRVRTYPGNMHTPDIFFEALTYESGPMMGETDFGQMTYDITLRYKDVPDKIVIHPKETELSTTETTYASLRADLNDDTAWPVNTSRLYVLKSKRGNYFIRQANEDSGINGNITGNGSLTNLAAIQTDIDNGNEHYVWELTKVVEGGENRVKIRNIQTGNYLIAPTENVNGNNDSASYLFTTDIDNATAFEVKQYFVVNGTAYDPGNTVAFSSNASGSDACMHMTTNYGNFHVVHMTTWCDDGAHYTPYLVTVTPEWQESVPFRKELKGLPINTFELGVGTASPLTEIKRNDHINVQIGVTYNPEKQDVEFEVRQWNTSDNDLSFD